MRPVSTKPKVVSFRKLVKFCLPEHMMYRHLRNSGAPLDTLLIGALYFILWMIIAKRIAYFSIMYATPSQLNSHLRDWRIYRRHALILTGPGGIAIIINMRANFYGRQL